MIGPTPLGDRAANDPGSPTRRRRNSGRPSIRDVAAAAGVSHQTVSRVINRSPNVSGPTRAAVEATITKLGYRPNNFARELARLRSGRIGFVTSHLNEYGPRTFNLALHRAAEQEGFEVILIALNDWQESSIDDAFERLQSQSVEAIVLAANSLDVINLVRDKDMDVPVIIVSGAHEQHPLGIGIDNEPGARIATGHLLDLGHTSVALIGGPAHWIEAQQRFAGWAAAHAARDVAPGPRWTGDWTPASGHLLGAELAARSDVTAVFVSNDQMALGVLLALSESGRDVPDDISVVGFDDLPEAAWYRPPLTTIHQDFAEVARGSLDLAKQAIAGVVDLAAVRIEPRLVVRSTTAPPSS